MSFWKSTPELRLFVPPQIHVGESITVTLEIEAKEPTDVEWVDLELRATEGWAVGSGSHRSATSLEHPTQRARVVDASILSGITRRRVTFEIPPGQPPSFSGGGGWVRYEVSARASIPFWPDAKASWLLEVRGARRAARAIPAVLATRPEDPLEFSLESQRVASGGVVGGLVAPRVMSDTARELRLRVSEVLTHLPSPAASKTGLCFETTVVIPPLSDAAVPFRFRLPNVVASFTSAKLDHGWVLSASTPSRGLSLFEPPSLFEIPLELVESDELAEESPALLAPLVGPSRRREILDATATRSAGWARADDELVRAFEAASGAYLARIGWTIEAGRPRVAARLETPCWGLELAVRRRTGVFDGALTDTIRVPIEAWASRHIATARDRAQATGLVASLAAVAPSFDWHASDTEIAISSEESGDGEANLRTLVERVEALFDACEAARSSVPSPRDVSLDRERALAIARRLRGRFQPGDCALRANLDERAFSARVRFSRARPAGIEIAVEPVESAALDLTLPRDPSTLASLPGEARALVDARLGGLEVMLREGRASAFLPAPDTAPLLVDHERSLAIAEALIALGRVLSGAQVPFR